MADYYDRTPEQIHHIYKERARSLNVLRFFVALLPFTAVVVIFNRWFRLLFEPAADVVNPAAGTNQAVVSVNGNCLFLLVVIFALFLGAAMWRAITRENKELKDTKPNHRHQEATRQAETMTRNGDPITIEPEPAKDPVEELVREMKERQKRIRLKNFEKRWQRSLRHGTQLQRPFDMSDREWYSRPVWTSDDIYQWLKERQE